MSEILNWEIVFKTVMSELVSISMPDHVLTRGDSGGGKAKSGMMGIGGWLGGKWNGEGIQLVGSSWAKKMIFLRLKIVGMLLFDYLFICIVILRLLCYNVLNWTLYMIWS